MSEQQPGEPAPLPLGEAASRLLADGTELGNQLSALASSGGELFKAELALSRSALGRTLLYGAIALILAGSAWLCLIAALVFGLHALGCPSWAALLLAALIFLFGSLVCVFLLKRVLPDLGWPRSMHRIRQLLQPAESQSREETSP